MRAVRVGFSVLVWSATGAWACDLPAPPDISKAPFVKPVEGEIGAGFGLRFHPILRFDRPHNGLDFLAPIGTPVTAALGGSVLEAKFNGEWGNRIFLDHGGGVETTYSHLSRYADSIAEGACVRPGDVIGYVGNTGLSAGPHLHFEVHHRQRPVDPAPLIGVEVPAELRGQSVRPR